jgi:hypothetical protein
MIGEFLVDVSTHVTDADTGWRLSAAIGQGYIRPHPTILPPRRRRWASSPEAQSTRHQRAEIIARRRSRATAARAIPDQQHQSAALGAVLARPLARVTCMLLFSIHYPVIAATVAVTG